MVVCFVYGCLFCIWLYVLYMFVYFVYGYMFCTWLYVLYMVKISKWSKITKVTFVILDHSLIFRVTYTRRHIDTTDSPDDEHMGVQKIYKIEINIYKKELCIKLVIYKNEIHPLSHTALIHCLLSC